MSGPLLDTKERKKEKLRSITISSEMYWKDEGGFRRQKTKIDKSFSTRISNLFLIFYFFFHHQPFEMLNDSKSYRQRHHWVAENKRKKKRQERQRAASFYRIAVSRTTRGISRTPFKCPENAHTQKRRQSTRSIVSFLFARALLLLLGYSQVCGTPIDWRKEFICVCVCPLLLRARGGRVKTFQRIRFHSPITKWKGKPCRKSWGNTTQLCAGDRSVRQKKENHFLLILFEVRLFWVDPHRTRRPTRMLYTQEKIWENGKNHPSWKGKGWGALIATHDFKCHNNLFFFFFFFSQHRRTGTTSKRTDMFTPPTMEERSPPPPPSCWTFLKNFTPLWFIHFYYYDYMQPKEDYLSLFRGGERGDIHWIHIHIDLLYP